MDATRILLTTSGWLMGAFIAGSQSWSADNGASTTSVSALPTASGNLIVDDYQPPKARVRPQKNDSAYPRDEALAGREGWVRVNMMVDQQGKPYEIAVVDSTGNTALEQAAIQLAARYQFEPATLNGTPVDASHALKVNFKLENFRDGASPEFIKKYKQLWKALNGADQPTADELLKKLKVQNLYEDAFYHLALAEYLKRWGNSDKERLQALRHALAYESYARYLGPNDFAAVLEKIFWLEVKTQNLGGALETYERFDQNKKNDPSISKAVEEIRAIRYDDSVYAVREEIPKTGSWSYRLLKRHFNLLVSEGDIAEIKLRCEKRYVFAPYKADVEYAVPEEYGLCDLELIGDDGTKFTLIQS